MSPHDSNSFPPQGRTFTPASGPTFLSEYIYYRRGANGMSKHGIVEVRRASASPT
jgi:hypothetical protein